MQEVTITTPFITLGQLLKKIQAVDSGGQVKALLATGSVRVNGVPELRRGRKLYPGDTVTLHRQTYTVRNE